MYAAFTAMALFSVVFVLLLALGLRTAIGALRLLIWLVSTKAGWITFVAVGIVLLLFW